MLALAEKIEAARSALIDARYERLCNRVTNRLLSLRISDLVALTTADAVRAIRREALEAAIKALLRKGIATNEVIEAIREVE